MRKIIFYEPVEKINLRTVTMRMEKECPEYVGKWRKMSYMLMSEIIRGAYIPNSVEQISDDLLVCLYGFKSVDFVCMPPNIPTIANLNFHDIFYNAVIYLEKGSMTERFFTSPDRKFKYKLKHGLPVIDGKRIEHSDYFTLWISENDSENEKLAVVKEKSIFYKKAAMSAFGFLIAAIIMLVFAKLLQESLLEFTICNMEKINT